MKITKVTRHGKRTHYRACEIEEIISLMQSEEMRRQVESFRLKWYTTFRGLRQALLVRLPQILFSGAYQKRGKEVYNGYIPLEICHLKDNAEVERVKQTLAEYPQVLLAMAGATGRSVVFLLRYVRPDGTLPEEEEMVKIFHAHAYRHALKTFEPELGIAIELKEPSPQQEYPMSYDAAIYYNPLATPILMEQPTAMPAESLYQEQFEKISSQPVDTENVYERHRFLSMQYELAFRQALEESGEEVERMEFKPLLVRTARLCFRAGIEEEECTKWCILHLGNFLNEVEIRQTIGNVYGFGEGFGNAPLVLREQVTALRLEEFMDRRYELRYNTMTDAPEYRERNSFCFEFRPITKRVQNSIALNAQKEGIAVWDRDIQRYVCSDRLPDHAPIEEYLKRLPEWDGVDRIRPLMKRVPTRNAKWGEHSYRWFLSMVAHWQGRDKEHGNTLSPLLVGEQGCGKSTFCINLLPPELKMYYTDSIDFSRKRDAEIFLTRFALINLDEFDQVNEQHQGFLKHLQQKPVVNVRRPYATQVEALKRYASFIATSNHTDLLNDLSGSRRFICIEINGVIDNSQPIEYEQLYSQAIAALDSNERYWLTHDEELALMSDNEEFRQRPIAEDLFYRYYRPATSQEEGIKLSAGEIYLSLQKKSGLKLPATQLSNFGRFLKKTIDQRFNSNRGALYLVIEQ